MSLLLDMQYGQMLAPYVRNFAKKPGNVLNFSCPLCGDSTTNLRRARGYLFKAGDSLLYSCQNCKKTMSVYNLLKQVDNNLASQYQTDKFLENKDERKYEPVVREASFAEGIDETLIKVSSLPPHHPCKQYVVSRKIPSDKHYLLYYTDDFRDFTTRVDPNAIITKDHRAEPRLIIPLITETQEVAGYQGRSLNPSIVKYLTVLYNENNGKLFGLDRVDFNRRMYAFEGPLDALFIDNSIATTGGRIDTLVQNRAIDRKKTIICYDNEPRSKFTVDKIKKALDNSFPVFIWPDNIAFKDVNDCIVGGVTADEIKQMIDSNTFTGLDGQLRLTMWRKV